MLKSKSIPVWLVFVQIFLALSMGMYLPAVEIVKGELGLSQREALLSVSLWFIGSGLMTPLAGFISIAVGRRRIILIGLAAFGVLNGMIYFFEGKELFLVFRFLQGALNSLVLIPANALIHDIYPDKKAIKVMAMMSSLLLLVTIFGPVVGAGIIKVMSWDIIFMLLGVLSLGLLIPLGRVLPVAPQIKEGEAAIFEYSRAKSYVRYLLCFTLGMGSNTLWITASPLILMKEFQFTTFEYAVFQMVISSGILVGALLIHSLIEKYELNQLIVISIGMATVFVTLFGLFVVSSKSMILLGMIFFLGLVNFGFIIPVLYRLVMTSNLFVKDHVASIINSFVALGALGGASLATYLYAGNYLPIVMAQWVCNFLILLCIWKR